ncbi:MAG: FG-GAP repeat domain-containing protein [Planctomycetota bacterium]|jgi:hypothetical protein
MLCLVPPHTSVAAGDGLFGAPQPVTTAVFEPVSVHAADLDDDGDLDVLTAAWVDDSVHWFENVDGLGTFALGQLITSDADRAYSVHAADIDGDGDLDVTSASFADGKIAWYENTDGLGTFGPQQVITTSALGAWSAQAGDLDGDGDVDVVSASDTIDTIQWYENTDGLGTFGPPIVLSTTANGAVNVSIADLDGDLDNDVLAASALDDTVQWFRNTDGAGQFSDAIVITSAADDVRSVHAADLDGDSDLDVLSASGLDATIAWHENLNGLGDFGPRQVITNLAAAARTVWAADLDGDDDIDVLSASHLDDTIAWYENTNGSGTFGPRQVISSTSDGAFTVRAADLDGDGDPDVLAGILTLARVEWYPNNSSPWNNLGNGLAGTTGQPTLLGGGTLVGGEPVELALDRAAPSATATLVFGWSELSAPFKGGVLVPAPDLLFVTATNGDGEATLGANWPSGVPSGFSLFAQWWVSDAGGPNGFAASNAVRGTTP